MQIIQTIQHHQPIIPPLQAQITPNRPYDVLIFDWDGTLMDSTSTIAACLQAACVAVGEPEPSLELAQYVIGLGLQDALQQCAPHCPPTKHPELAAQYRRHFLAQDTDLRLFTGVPAQLKTFLNQGYALAVATGKYRDGLDRVLKQTELGSLFASTRTADKTEAKPSPRMVFEILEELNVPPSRALMIGDTTHDIQMAHNAKIASFAVAQGAHPHALLAQAKPTYLAWHIHELPAWLALQPS